MDMEAEMVYADILRTLQSSILNTNVSFTTELSRVGSCRHPLWPSPNKCGPWVNIYNIMQALVLNFQKSSHQQAIEFNGACFLLSVLCTNDLYMG